MQLPRISIVTPSFNQGQFIERTICSVLDQGYPNLEYIIIDGGSRDGTVETIRKYEKHLAYWVSEEDRGQTHAINTGMARATGEIRAYLNSDDEYLPNALLSVADAVKSHPDTDLFYGGCSFIDEHGHCTGAVRYGDISTLDDMADVWGVWWQGRHYVQPEVFWTSRIAERIGEFDEKLYYVMDYEYWLRMFAAGVTSRRLEQPIAAFRQWGAQKSQQKDRLAAEQLMVLRNVLWDRSAPLSRSERYRLQANWLYSEVFRPEADRLSEAGRPRLSRYAALGACIARHPKLLAAPGMATRVRALLRGSGLARGRTP